MSSKLGIPLRMRLKNVAHRRGSCHYCQQGTREIWEWEPTGHALYACNLTHAYESYLDELTSKIQKLKQPKQRRTDGTAQSKE